ncbi:hypothetical protein ARMSODRAFT_1027935 [Armillaria solidipes]|uniref:Aminoglycoside phosphotransferase domain-containing protein n=1 Tax=Armillaria solidipes TaxID=1076256 RepID=A0A2H3AV97_9AGAR|nr:hypothetical protein ARMSODRAFT_1027935 [Armillaria solidipes]
MSRKYQCRTTIQRDATDHVIVQLRDTATNFNMYLGMEFLHNESSREHYHASISKFNFDALQQRASEHRGVQCIGYETIAQGGYNTVSTFIAEWLKSGYGKLTIFSEVFLLSFEDGQELIARLSGSRSGQDDGVPDEILSYRMKSEVATMRYVEAHTSIPIPHIHLAEFDSTNAVRTRFMLMDRPEGRETVFPVLGSFIYEQGTVGPLSRSCTRPPLLGLDCGPFKSTKDYILANIYAEMKLVQERHQEQKQSEDRKALTGGLGDASLEDEQKWLSLLAEGVKGLQDDALDPPHNPYVLFHDDFKWANVLVSAEDPPQVVGLLDWEGSRICPVWDNRRLGGIIIPDRVEDLDELAHYREIMWDTFRDAHPCTGFSLHLWNYFLHIVDYGHSLLSKREIREILLLNWYEAVCTKGLSEDIKSLALLHLYIQECRRKRT